MIRGMLVSRCRCFSADSLPEVSSVTFPAGRQEANMNMYDGPGACGVFRALQGWTSLSDTRENEGTLRVYPSIRESSAYMMLRPFFKWVAIVPKTSNCHPDLWPSCLDR
jgi:hypothetical protein